MQNKIWFVLVFGLLLVACSTFSESSPVPSPTLDATPSPTPEPTATPTFVFGPDAFSQGMIARRNGDYARAVAAFQATLNSNPLPDVAREAQFRLAEAYWLYGDEARAINGFAAYLQANPDGAHASESRYMAGDSYRALQDYGNALAQLRVYRDQTQALIGDTDAMIADIMVLAGDAAGAIQQYDRALQDKTLSVTARINILQRVADVHSGRSEPALAAGRYDAALAIATDARTRADLLLKAGESYAAARQLNQAIARWNEAFAKYPDQPGAYQSLIDLLNRSVAVDDFQRGFVDYNAASYDAAVSAFQDHLQSASPRAGEAHYYLASSYARKGAYSQAVTEFDTILKTLPKDKRVPDAYMGKASAFGNLGRVDDAVAVYKKFAATLPDDPLADDALWRAALLLDRAKRYDDAADLYEQVQSKYPGRERAAEALFWAGWDYYLGKDFKTAMARWQTVTKDYAKSAIYDRAVFWLGKIAQARGQSDAARNYWSQASGSNTSYYSWRAKDMVASPPRADPVYDAALYAMDDAEDRAALERWLTDWSKAAGAPGTLDTATREHLNFRRGAELLRLDRTVEARREFMTLIAEKQNDPRALYALALYLRDNNLFSLSMDCAERIARLSANAGAPPAPRLLWMLRYPAYYVDLIIPESRTNQVDPLLYLALVRQESTFNPWSKSSADARGLGQIIPSTGREIAQRLGVKNFSLDQLYLPYISIRFGVWYFAQGLKRFEEPIYALAAYNAGAGRAARWQQSDLDLAVESIDASETNSYVRIVYSNWRTYQNIYK